MMESKTYMGLANNKIVRDLKQWVIHENKQPKQINGYGASVTNSKTWHSYEEVSKYQNKGFVFTESDNLLFIDLDHVLDENKQIKYNWARDIVDNISSYTEISFSGDGLHIIVESTEHNKLMMKTKFDDGSALEIYYKERYATVTDNVFENKSQIVKNNCDVLYKYAKYKSSSDNDSFVDYNRKSDLSKEEIIAKLKEKDTHDRILWDANDLYYKDDQSVADAQLSSHIIYYCNGDFDMFKKVFSEHSFGLRDKWINREDYKKRLFDLCMQDKQNFYLVNKNKGSVYLLENKYHIITPTATYSNLLEKSKNIHCKQLLLNPKKFDIVSDMSINVDYFSDEAVSWKLTKNRNLIITENPTKNWDLDLELDNEIINDYTNNVLNGKLVDILLIVFLSIRFKEDKLNKLLLIGSSNKGKTKLAELMGFFDISAGEFYHVFGDKQKKVSRETVIGLKKCGLLHADDIQFHLPSNIKNIKDSARIDVMHGGAIKVPIKFLLMSTTNDEVIATANDEIANRILVVDIGDDTYTVNNSKVCQKDTDKYELHCEIFIKKCIVDILNDTFERDALQKLQEKYKINLDNNDRSEIIENIREKLSREFSQSTYSILHNGSYYARNKQKLKTRIKDVLNAEFDGKYFNLGQEVSKLTKYFIKERTTAIIDDVKDNYYRLENIPDTIFQDIDM